MAVSDLLEQFGLSKKERQVYQAALRLGTSTASQIAAELNVPRQTVYSILAKLLEMRLVKQGDVRGVKQFSTDPRDLLIQAEVRKQLLEDQRREVERQLPDLLASQKRGKAFPKVQYYEGDEGLLRLFDSILDLHRRGVAEEFRGYGVNQMHEPLHGKLDAFIKRRASYGVRTRLFIGKGADDFGIKDASTAHGREVKRLAMPQQHAGVYIVANRVYLFSYEDGVGVMVENDAIAKLLTDVFDAEWSRN